jgi:hypothetical protein
MNNKKYLRSSCPFYGKHLYSKWPQDMEILQELLLLERPFL